MKKLIAFSIVAFALMSAMALAQPTRPPAAQGTYEVRPGDNLWTLSGGFLGDPHLWREVLADNPFLGAPGRQFTLPDGRFVVLIRPGEKLNLERLQPLGVAADPLPISVLRLPESERGNLWDSIGARNSLLVLLLFLAALVLPVFWRLRVRRNAATAGEPVIPSGIPSDRPDEVAARFQWIAEQRHAEANPLSDPSAARPVRVGPIEDGFLSGRGRVQYRDCTKERQLEREPAYRARFRMPDGHEENLHFLQACANDVTFGGARYEGFTFEPRRVVAPTPRPTPAPLPPLRVVGRSEEEATPATTIAVGGYQLVVPVGATVELTGKHQIRIAVPRACEISFARVETGAVRKSKTERKPAAGQAATA